MFIDTGLGRGTTFKIAVPALSKEDWVGDDQVESSPLKGHRFLVLDDAPLVRRQIHRLLKRRGCEVVEAETIEQALDAMHEPIHVAVLDFMLRSTTGDVALVELRSIQPDLPAVLCSGYISPEHHHKTTGFAEVVHKPFTQSELLGALERTIRGGKEN